MNTFLLDYIQCLIKKMKRLCLCGLMEWLWPHLADTPGFVELWVLCWVIVGWFALGASHSYFFILLAILRVWEILWRQLNQIVNDRAPTENQTRLLPIYDQRRSFLLALFNYIEIIVWFAVVYRFVWSDLKANDTPNSCISALYFSVVTMATVGYGDIHAKVPYTQIIVTLQIAVGLFMTLVVLARIIGFFKQPPESEKLPPKDNK